MNLKIDWKLIVEFIYKTGKIIDLNNYSYQFLLELNQIIPFYAANFFLFDENKEIIGEPICCNVDKKALKSYNDYYWQIDDIRNLVFDQQEAIISSQLMDYQIWTETEYFNDFLAKNNLYYSCGIDIHAENKLLGTISLFRTQKDKDFNSLDLIYLNILAKHSSNHLKKIFKINSLNQKYKNSKEMLINKKAQKFNLSSREIDVLKLVLAGKHNQEIADKLNISINTVKKHLSHIYHKTKVQSRNQLTALVYQN